MVAFAEHDPTLELSESHRRVIETVAVGVAGGVAWAGVYGTKSAASARCSASRLLARPAAKLYLAELSEDARGEAVLSLAVKRKMLRDIAEDRSLPARDRIRAIELDCRIAGDFAPAKVEHDAAENPLAEILKAIRGA